MASMATSTASLPQPTNASETIANASAVELSDVGGLDVPFKLTSDRMRRRSELARVQPVTTPTEEIELSTIQEDRLVQDPSTHNTDSPSVPISTAGAIVFRPNPTVDDVEIAPSFPNSLTPSMRFEEEAGSEAALAPPAQTADQKRKVLVNFATVCLCAFFTGWNDGTTGPLLPRIQEFYHVSSSLTRLFERDITDRTHRSDSRWCL